jgi:hypothetical protein
MKCFLGKELKIGDTIIQARNAQYGERLCFGVVRKFTATKVSIQVLEASYPKELAVRLSNRSVDPINLISAAFPEGLKRLFKGGSYSDESHRVMVAQTIYSGLEKWGDQK